jgi:DNA-damage-inducible protein D
MEQQIVTRLYRSFEDAAYQEGEVEYWLARDLQELPGYDEWRNFMKAIDKAKASCEKSGQDILHHFVDVNKMVELGKGVQRVD